MISAARAESLTIGAVFSAHFVSHFYQVAFAPVLPLVTAEFGIGFTEAGLVFSLLYLSSGIGQPIAGMLVDRFGAHRLLILGVFMQAGGVLAMGFTTNFVQLLPLAVLVGLGNSVYHPADLSILSRRVALGRHGRAFAIHQVAASAGFAASPVIVGWMALSFGWRNGLIVAGLFGLTVGVALVLFRALLRIESAAMASAVGTGPSKAGRTTSPARLPLHSVLLLPVVVAGFATFTLTGLSAVAVFGFGVAAFTSYGVILTAAAWLVASYQFGMVGGILAGGLVAEQTASHRLVAIAGAAAAAILTLGVASNLFPYAVLMLLVAGSGVAHGVLLPSRDILLRAAAPPERLGTAFGAVYSGLDFGGLVGPLIYGPLLDLGRAQLVYVVSAVLMALSILAVVRIGGANSHTPRPG